jgi:hypothetical protein
MREGNYSSTAWLLHYSAPSTSLSPSQTSFNEHVRLAQAMLQGHLWVAPPPTYIEHFTFQGRQYLVQPPGPALLLLPFVWLFGVVDQAKICCLIGALGVAAYARFLARSGFSAHETHWLIAFFGLGTIFAYEASLGASWGFALISSVPFTLLALTELSDDHWLRVGIWAGAAALFRYDLVLIWPIYALMSIIPRSRSARPQLAPLWVMLGTLPAAAVLIWFNWARFGSPFITDLSLYAPGDPQAHQSAPFALHFLPGNLSVLRLTPPYLDANWPYLHPHMAGQSILWTSPAFLLALYAPLRRNTVWLWNAVLAGSLPSLLVYASGYVQFGARYYIRIYPFVLLLMGIAVREHGLDYVNKGWIVLSIALVLFGTAHSRLLGWGW